MHLRAHRQSPNIQPRCLHEHIFFRFQQHRHASRFSQPSLSSTIPPSPSAPHRERPPRDEEIRSWSIHVVGPDGRLSEPRNLFDVLDSRKVDEKGRPTEYLQQVSAPTRERPCPICKLFDKQQARETEHAKRKAKKEKKIETKTLVLNWTVSDNDLGYRLVRLKEFLGKGSKVEIAFGTKRKGWMGKRAASEEEIERVLERIRGAVSEVEGAKVWKEMAGQIGGEAVLSFQGPPKNQPKTSAAGSSSTITNDAEDPGASM